MRIDEVARDILLEMAYTRKRAEAIITGLEFQTNLHLLKLVAVPSPEQVPHWTNELLAWLTTIASIRLKPSSKPGPAKFYYTILFDEPFGGQEEKAVISRLQLLRHQYGAIRPDIEASDLADRLRRFHRAFANGCASGSMDLEQIKTLLADYMRQRP